MTYAIFRERKRRGPAAGKTVGEEDG